MLFKKITSAAFILCSYEYILQNYIYYLHLQSDILKIQMKCYNIENKQSTPELVYHYNGTIIPQKDAACLCEEMDQKIRNAKKYTISHYFNE